jgi:hypothetical protein
MLYFPQLFSYRMMPQPAAALDTRRSQKFPFFQKPNRLLTHRAFCHRRFTNPGDWWPDFLKQIFPTGTVKGK